MLGPCSLILAMSLLAGRQEPHELLELPPATLFQRDARDGGVPLEPGETLTSIVLRPSATFRELLPSWNLDAPAGTGFVVELAVAGGEGGWSPWLHVGDWCAPARASGSPVVLPALEERTTQIEGARVEVDVLRGERSFERARVRVRALGTSERPLVVRRFAIVSSDMTRFVAPGRRAAGGAGCLTEPVEQIRCGSALPVRRQGAEDPELAPRICSPTSLAMVLEHFGIDVATERVAGLVHDPAHDLYGNWNRAVQAAWSLGLTGRLERFSDWPSVAASLLRGERLVISVGTEHGVLRGAPYAETSGHLLVLWGLDREGRALVNDPAAEDLASVPRAYLPQDLEQAWMGRGGVAYVLGPAAGAR